MVRIGGIGHSDPDWISKAIKRPGALTAKAKNVGLKPLAFAKKNIKKPGLVGRQSRLALTLNKLRK